MEKCNSKNIRKRLNLVGVQVRIGFFAPLPCTKATSHRLLYQFSIYASAAVVMPRRPVEEHIIAYLDEQVRNRLTSGDGRANIWVVDDEHLHEYYLTIVDRDHRYSIISWSHVLQNRQLTEGQVLRFGWMDQKLHFVVIDKENDDGAEENKADGKDNEDERDQGEKDTAKEVAEPAKKKAKQDTGEASTSQPHTGVIVDP